ncbi:MAG: hypothetical protein SO046_02305 [Actinomyces urogenitalis]|uniref:relaxase/mobilization nuclease domain-containing protein n=1 Tax=Actinomyces urogenitalis TaxID=103621 RepID=UPI002A81C056|nr:hypothetical protein [Actinomyces urogenitalis]MDY3678038.1 hypothetical protein [Actinomyces urogenitalis]
MRALTNGKRIAKTRSAVDYELYGTLGSAKFKMHKAAGTNRVAAIRCDVGDVEAYVQRAEALARKHGRKIEARSFILSFKNTALDANNPDDVERVADLGYGWAKEMAPNSDVLVIVHIDGHGGHPHAHIKILNHDNVTEKAVRGLDMHFRFSKIADAYLAAEAPDLPDQPRQHEGDQASYWEQMRDGASVPEFDRWLGDAIEEVLSDPTIVDEDSYRAALEAKGIELIAETRTIKAATDGSTPERESIGWTYKALDTFGEKQRKRRRKASTFGTAATHDGAHEVFADNAARAKAAQQVQAPTTPVLPVSLAASFSQGDDEFDKMLRDIRLAYGLAPEPTPARRAVEDAAESVHPVAAPAVSAEQTAPPGAATDWDQVAAQRAEALGLPNDDAVWQALSTHVRQVDPDLHERWYADEDGVITYNDLAEKHLADVIDDEIVAAAVDLGYLAPAAGQNQPVRDQERAADVVGPTHPAAAPAAPVVEDSRVAAPAAPEPVEPSAAPAASARQTAAPAAATRQSGQPSTAQGAAETEQSAAYVSRLRTMRGKTEAVQKLIDAMAGFDEDCHARLAQGLRPVEADVPTGYGPKTHAQFRDYLADDVVAQLDMRFTKKDARREAFETGRDLAAEVKAMRAAGQQWTDEFETKVRRRNAANARRERLEEELAAGIYEDIVTNTATARPVIAMLRPVPGKHRDDYQLG